MEQPPPEQQWTLVGGDPAQPSQVIRPGRPSPEGATVVLGLAATGVEIVRYLAVQ